MSSRCEEARRTGAWPTILAFLGGTVQDADAVARSASGPTAPRRIVRHNLTNTRFLELHPTQARVESYFTVLTELGLDHYGRYRDVFVPVGDEWLTRAPLLSRPTGTLRLDDGTAVGGS